VKKITDQFTKYCNMVGSLPHESLRMVADIVESPPQETPYLAIKQRLLASQQLTSFQRAEKLFAMPPLGNRKPSDLMAAMLEICPRGEEKTDLFACLFLQWLPREIRILLADADHKDPLSRPPPVPDTGADLSRVATCPGQPSFNRPGPQSSVESSVVEQPVIAAAVGGIVDFAAMVAAQE
jgi:hypothetical protein